MHMAGFENLPRLQSACLHSMLLPCSLKDLKATRAWEKQPKCLFKDLRETSWWSKKTVELAILRCASSQGQVNDLSVLKLCSLIKWLSDWAPWDLFTLDVKRGQSWSNASSCPPTVIPVEVNLTSPSSWGTLLLLSILSSLRHSQFTLVVVEELLLAPLFTLQSVLVLNNELHEHLS